MPAQLSANSRPTTPRSCFANTNLSQNRHDDGSGEICPRSQPYLRSKLSDKPNMRKSQKTPKQTLTSVPTHSRVWGRQDERRRRLREAGGGIKSKTAAAQLAADAVVFALKLVIGKDI